MTLASEKESKIANFYKGQKVFITGGTGFLGKVLIEKLLRSCSDISRIYILIRQKRGKSIEERKEKLFSEQIFNRLEEKYPHFREKLTLIPGDISEPNLDLDEKDRKLLVENVNIVFHGAATVNFEEPIKNSVKINIRGTKEILRLCHEMNHLKALVHVSTAYANSNRHRIEEKLYEPRIPADKLIELTDLLPEDVLDSITPQLKGKWPNTYAFTKQIAEDCVSNLGKGLPVAIFRPSIVIATCKEPVPGWIDNLYGPTGIIVAATSGIMRVSLSDPTKKADIVPVDYCVNALITVPWDMEQKKNCSQEIPIYNYVSSCDNPITWGDYTKFATIYQRLAPSNKALWYATMMFTTNLLMFRFLTFFLHIIPALLMDLVLAATNQKKRMMDMYAKIHKFALAIRYFGIKEWEFKNQNVKDMWSRLNEVDRKTFDFNLTNFSWKEMIKEQQVGIRMYLMKEDESTIPAAIRRMYILLVLHRLLQVTAVFIVLRTVVWLLKPWLSFTIFSNLPLESRISYYFTPVMTLQLSFLMASFCAALLFVKVVVNLAVFSRSQIAEDFMTSISFSL